MGSEARTGHPPGPQPPPGMAFPRKSSLPIRYIGALPFYVQCGIFQYLHTRSGMVSFLKSLELVVGQLLAGVPETLRVVLEFVWKARWFLVGYVVLATLYGIVMKVLPFLLWSFAIKSAVGSVFSLFSSL